MKKIILLTATATAIAIAIAGCEDFTTSYDRVEETEFRLLDFKYERANGLRGTDTADIAPGDSMILTAVFAGKPVDLESHLKWKISFNVMRDLIGTTTVVDSMLLDTVKGVERIPPLFYSDNTMSVSFKIPIPKDIVRKSAAIPEIWTNALPAEMRNDIPSALAALSKTQIINIIEAYIDNESNLEGIDLDNDEYSLFISNLLSFFTVPIRVMADVKMDEGRLPHSIRSNHYIRYNRHFEKLGVPVNTNPKINSVIVFEVKGDIGTFHDKSGYSAGVNYDTIKVNADGVLEIRPKSGYTYFLEALTADSKDSTTTMFGNRMQEDHYAYWHYHIKDAELSGVKYTDYMDIYNGTGRLTPPGNKKIQNFVLWVTVTDDVKNERFRPEGGTFAEVVGRFVYE